MNNIYDLRTKIAKIINKKEEEIYEIKKIKKGMTNEAFTFKTNDNQYIIRLPGVGTNLLINREHEGIIYGLINDKNISEKVIYFDRESGCKISEFLKDAKTVNPFNESDIKIAIDTIKKLHSMKLKVEFEFDLYERIDFYEKLINKSKYDDYAKTKQGIYKLRSFIEKNVEQKILAHIDFVYDNVLLVDNYAKLIDWEYAGMQDPHIDIAMFCIYALYDRKHIDNFIDLYFNNNCAQQTRVKIYCYIATCGLLWSNWCEYKETFGVKFGAYAKKQYDYAKEYLIIASQLIKQEIYNGKS